MLTMYLLSILLISSLMEKSVAPPLPPCPFDSTKLCRCAEDPSSPNTYNEVWCELHLKNFPQFTGPNATYIVKIMNIDTALHDWVMSANSLLPIKKIDTMTINAGFEYMVTHQLALDPASFTGPQVSELYLSPFTNTFPLPEAIVTLGKQGLQTLSILRANSVALGANTFQTFRNLNTLYITDTPISSVDDLAFAGMEDSLKSLYLLQDQISEYPAAAIGRLVNLEGIQMTNNSMKSFSRAAFAPLTKLRYLDLSHNYLKAAADAGAFYQFPATAENLNLAFGSLTEVPAEIFETASTLSILNLRYNNISTVRHDDFAKSTSLTKLYLENNPISTIESGAFSSLTKTQKLDLFNATLKSVDFSLFDGMTELVELSICCQKSLTEVTISSLDKISTKFNTIDISAIGIRVIDPNFKSIVQLPDFKVLYLSNNQYIECNEDMQWVAPYALCPPYSIDVHGSTCGNIAGKKVFDYLSETVPDACKQ